MNQEIALINRLDAMGIQLRLNDGKLTTRSAPGSVTAEIAALIRQQRDGLIAFLRQRELGEALKSAAIPALAADTHPLSYAQKRLWLIDRMGDAGAAYHIPAALRIEGKLDRDALERAFDAMVERHAVLRTVYIAREGEPMCEVRPHARFTLDSIDLAAGETLAAVMAAENARPFDLSCDLMLRATLVGVDANCHVLLLNMHHIASDGWSMGILVKELVALYEGATLAPLAVQYGDYAAWQSDWLAGGAQQRQLDYWKQRLDGISHLHTLPTDHPRPAHQQYQGAQYSCVLEDTSALHAVCRDAGATSFIALQLAFAVLLSRWTHETDIVLGTPVANRLRPELEGLIGFFVNTLVLRNQIDSSRSFADLLAEAVRNTASDFDHQSLPFDVLVEALNPVRSPAHAPLVQIMFSMHNAVPSTIRLDGLSLSGVDTAGVSAKFDLTLNVVESGATLNMSWQYSTALFEHDTIEAMAQQYLALLRDIGRRPAVPVARLDMLAPGEKERLLALNGAPGTGPVNSLPHLFRKQAECAPERIALVEGERQLTYAQLDDEVRRLAGWLVQRGTRDEQPIGIYMDRGVDMVVAILAILHAGGSYVPMDVTMPAERVALVVRDTGCELVLSSARRRAVLDGLPTEAVAVDLLGLDGTRHDDLPDARGGRRLAYLMYTSGSTGQPKGAMIEQRGIVRLVCDSGYCRIAPEHTIAQSSNSSFDAATFEIFGALLNGACLSFIDVDTLIDPDRLEQAIERQGIDMMFLTTSLFHQSAKLKPRMFARLDTLLIGGEAIDKQVVDRVLDSGGKPRHLVNGYGPTENTTFTTAFDMREVQPAYPIGRPIKNTSCFVLGRGRELLPLGALGELYTGGDGVARGYLNRPQETAASFIADPFGGDGLLYKTGDLARWLPDGTLEYVGRSDFQIKLRGFRIELGEIEASLARLDAVQDAVVLARADEPGEKRLVAYVTAAPDETPDAKMLHDALSAHLPSYMLPSAYVVLDALPLNTNGKIDRRALPAPQSDAYLHARYEAPQGEHEQALAAIWQDLLRVERVGRNDNFFALGGHSLMAVQLCARIRGGGAITLRDVFEQPTLQALACRLEQAAEAEQHPIAHADRSAGVPLSWGQQSIWLIEQLGGLGAAYHMPISVRLVGSLDPNALRRALDSLVERHESLRTSFRADRQVIAAPAPFALREIDATGWSSDEIARYSTREATAPFDLGEGPLIRASLLEVSADTHLLLLVMHHIISDGWSIGVLIRELGALYTAYHDGLPNPLPPLAMQYADYAVWQREQLQGAFLQEQLDFWKQQLGGAPALLELPLDHARPSVQRHKGQTIGFALEDDLSGGLNALARERGMTLFTVLYAGFSIMLAKLSGQDDIVVGVPVANRQSSDVENLIGFFVNTLALRLRLTEGASVDDLLAQAQASTLAAYEHQELPFEQVVEVLQPPRTLAHSPVFQVMFNMQNTPSSALELPDLRLEAQPVSADVAQFELSIVLHESGGRIAGDVNYMSDLFDAATIERWIGHFKTVLAAMASDARQPVAGLSLLNDAELHKVTRLFNDTAADYPQDRLIHQLFEEQAARTPDAIALRHEDAQLSYAGLNERATVLARRLRKLGVGPDQRVGIFLERGIDMVVAVLATLKAGGAYVPLDPAYPAARLAYLLDDCEPTAVLTSSALCGRVRGARGLIVVDQDDGADVSMEPLETAGLTSSHLAYVIYTSGSTGMPKGVMVEHRQVLHLWRALGLAVFDQCAPASTIALNAGLSFDASVQALAQLLSGHCVAIVSAPVRLDAQAFLAFLADKRVDTFDCTPLQLEMLLQAGLLDAGLDSLKRVLVGGEAIGPALWRTLSACSSINFYNVYGPTECTVDATCIRINGDRNGPSIGRPLPNTSVYVVDAAMQPVAVGVSGELIIGGAGVARGYLNRPELTQERFVDDPASGGKRYRTGDLARWRNNGGLEYLGRNDFQFKMRGFRIEPGEIEACLTELAAVQEAVVLAHEESPGNTRLVAYYTAAAPVPAARLRQHATEGLPAHMVPAAYVHLPKWPLTANGKLDRRALAVPQSEARLHAQYEAPQGEHELALAAIWQELLQVERVGRNDNFFELGGHSLLAIRMLTQARAQLGAAPALASVFTHQTLAAFAYCVEQATGDERRHTAHADGSTAVPLSWGQQSIWLIEQLGGLGAAYHMPFSVRMVGDLAPTALRRALDSLVARHESLRTSFQADRQMIAPPAPFALREIDATGWSSDEIAHYSAREASAPFDLGKGPLMRASLLKVSADTHLLLFVMHHIISDGWSLGVLIRELGALYTAHRDGLPDPLPPLAMQYADYTVWQRDRLQGSLLQEQLDFWKQQLGGAPALLELPLDHARPSVQSHKGDSIGFALDGDLSARLNALARERGMTLFTVLYTGFSIMLAKLSGQDDIVVGVPVANRQSAQVEGLIGFFVNTLALRLRLTEGASVADLLAQAQESTLAAYEHQELPFEQVVEVLQPPRSLAHSPVFQVMFSLHNMPSSALELPGLRLEVQPVSANVAQFELSMSLNESGGRIAGDINYMSDLFDAATIERWIGHFQTVLAAMASDARQPVAALSLLSEAELHKVTRLFNDTAADYQHDRLLHQLFEEQAARTPDAIALSHAGEHLTYAQLNGEANRLAHCLRSHGAGPGRLVAISAQRNPAMVAGLLAILKAGAAYVPLDPDYPSERLEYMLRDSAAMALLTHGLPPAALRQQLGKDVPVIDLRNGQQWAHYSDANPVVDGLDPTCLSYVMYTSGSTGLSKGVMVEHRSVVNHLGAINKRLNLAPDDRVLQFVSVSFDAAVEDIFGALACGAALVLRTDEWLAGPDTFWSLCEDEQVSIIDLPTRFWAELAQSGAPAPACVRWVVIGGEALSESALACWLASGARPRLLNTYGPTEATISVTETEPGGADDWRNIGGPSQNTCIYILDRNMTPVPIGVAGELYIGGVQVARGYVNRPDLTAERFVEDPFGSAGRLYKSGDLGRWRADGSIDYLGRNDSQVKIRGFRIEPGEIEVSLAQALGLDVVAVAREDEPGDKRLVAYYGGATEFDASSLRAQASSLLPPYMMPTAFVHVPTWPQTPNGKLDRKALPRPTANSHAGRAYEAPLNRTEAAVARLWEALLKTGPLGRHDSFFELGGHSLLAVQVATQARREFGVTLTPVSVFTHQTVAEFASLLSAAGESARQALGADDHMVLREHAGGKAPVFCFPGLFANGLEFGSIATALGEERSVHAFVCPTLTRDRWEERDMAELAAMYADRIADLAKGGPVVLLGWSVGGYMAFEVAKLLRGRLEVPFVGVVDVHDAGEAARAPRLSMDHEDGLDSMLAQWARGTGMPSQWQRLFERFDHEEKQLAWEVLQDAPAWARTGTDVDGAEYRTWAHLNHGRMMRRYALQPAQVPVHVWVAGHSAARAARAESTLRDWSALAHVQFARVIDDSDHRTVLDHPAFLDQLRKHLTVSEPGLQAA
jgi:amino acid adenylation domain-containing protein